MPSGKREAASMHLIAALQAAQPEEIRQRRTAAEDTYQAIRNRLGAAGTFGDTAGGGLGLTTDAAAEGAFTESKITEGAAGAIDPRYTKKTALQTVRKLDPDK
jgi:hypothetical protein